MSRQNRIVAIVYSLLAVLIFSFASYILVGYVISEKKGDPFEYFGVSMHVVSTDSMTPELEIGDMVFIKSIDIADVKVGDDVLFRSPNPAHKGMNIIHRVVAIDSDGVATWLTTQGIRDGSGEDSIKISEIIGVKAYVSTIGGQLYLLGTTINGWLIMTIILVASVIIVKMLKNIFVKGKENEG